MFVLSSLQFRKDFQSSQNTVCQYFENKLVSLMKSIQYYCFNKYLLEGGVYRNTVVHTKEKTELLINIQLRVKFKHIYNSSGVHRTL